MDVSKAAGGTVDLLDLAVDGLDRPRGGASGGEVRFTDILDTVPPAVVPAARARLEELAAAALVERQGDQPHPVYALTDRGRDLRAVFREVERWNQRWATSK